VITGSVQDGSEHVRLHLAGTTHTADEIELLLFSCHGNRALLLRKLAITDMQ
jgi:hypothetical protein